MTADTPAPLLLLADTGDQPVVPGAAVLRMETTSSRVGLFDGAWWPRTRDLKTQLPGLITALTARLGPVARVGLDASAWDDAPGHLVIDDRMVRVDWSAVDDDTMIISRGPRDHFSFLVIPPEAPASAARAAMTMAVQDGNCTSAEQILTDTGIRP
ncbi:hypothetical protein HRW18_20605 [Streptomyces lunaelactis]|uniref:DUF5994 family protein n=1 Tax=Streptomyces lunaelactis TaxID=1535768 RepID=UPI001584E28E|nr:DUF5994 family protein [Streptomyces lunaelactis]NUK10338.1 hypothetical protein [Streptomyces lunaelactis]NUK34903.1 hypothetical protein [Streptomyces lunaelactis]NUK44234.1 hypothetical protein [Streptomyces lunaelactis]NUK94310.1 hypothetical protein [Streptomyces lunaelactis]NUL12578.1 hypothetical protein [Streptomyces lunaelactis]